MDQRKEPGANAGPIKVGDGGVSSKKTSRDSACVVKLGLKFAAGVKLSIKATLKLARTAKRWIVARGWTTAANRPITSA